ncbi:MAG: hypothetical protein EAX96_18425 [Candidatus Lokiarchaeota archaeon]|nr:hypothetical protein [Candidatus Lokiarchaeota archaeon]
MSKRKFSYGDIPDNFKMKEFYPLGRHTWDTLRELGVDYWDKGIESLAKPGALNDFFMARLNNSIETSKQVIDGTITEENSQKSFTYSLFPPIFCIRSDLQQGFQKLMMGESIDCSFVVIDDKEQEIFFILNTHQEDGIPQDFWNVNPTDDLLDRRHMKYGIKIKDFPKKMKGNLEKIGDALMSVLRDIRNERAPEWAGSDYVLAIAWMGAAVNSIYINSSYESMVTIFDYLNAKNRYGLPTKWVSFHPTPPTINTLAYMDRETFGLRFCGLTTANQLYFMGIEDKIYDWAMNEVPEIMNIVFHRGWGYNSDPEDDHYGTLLPAAEFQYAPPMLKKKEVYANGNLDFAFTDKKYEKWPKLTLETFNLDWDTARKGVYTDVSNLTTDKDKIDESNIVSLGLAKDTKIIK